MPLWKIAWRSIQHRSLASGLTAFSMSLGVALIVTVIVIYGVLDQSFRRSAQGYDLIVGPPGSSLELVISTVFYQREPIGTIPYDYFQELRTGRYRTVVEAAIPVALGEHYRGLPVVATSSDFFTKLEYLDGRKYQFQEGQNFSDGNYYDAVVGYSAAKKTGLKVGGKFKTMHRGEMAEDHTEEYTIVGVLRPTGTPNDGAIFVNIEGFFKMHAGQDSVLDQSLRLGTEPDKELSAVLVLTKEVNTTASLTTDLRGMGTEIQMERSTTRQQIDPNVLALPRRIEADLNAQAVRPAEVIAFLFEKIIGNIQLVLLILAALVVVVAGIGMMVSIYNSMNERRQEIAIMRALGARRTTVMAIILLESILLSLGGGAFGVFLGHSLIFVLGPWISEATGIMVSAWHFQWAELVLIPGLIALASIVGYLPAVIAYRTDVAQSLHG